MSCANNFIAREFYVYTSELTYYPV